eukprot:TRINITY_DN1475_c0_g2_i1.p1 TRINITY_DN1475_c0_g2~~TRINITY_DN1475_c0_g2_i1.p1  ORF type:complete len:190 (+),score=20.22 TRINITY_DN1475_c0_g2_i1:598-1167(+)
MDEFVSNANEILPGLWLGSEDAGKASLEVLKSHGVTHVLVPAYIGQNPIVYPEHLTYMHLNLRDVSGVNIVNEFKLAFRFISAGLEQGGSVLVHCAMGISRSASFVVGYLMQSQKMSYRDAETFVRKKRSVIDTQKKFGDQLSLWEKMGCQVDGDTDAHRQYKTTYKPFTVGRDRDFIPKFLTTESNSK